MILNHIYQIVNLFDLAWSPWSFLFDTYGIWFVLIKFYIFLFIIETNNCLCSYPLSLSLICLFHKKGFPNKLKKLLSLVFFREPWRRLFFCLKEIKQRKHFFLHAKRKGRDKSGCIRYHTLFCIPFFPERNIFSFYCLGFSWKQVGRRWLVTDVRYPVVKLLLSFALLLVKLLLSFPFLFGDQWKGVAITKNINKEKV